MKTYQPGDRICIRDQFMALAAGILLGRDRNGHIIVGDTEEAYLAMEHHGAGGIVWLTEHGQIVSYVEHYYEHPLEEDVP